MLTDPVSKQMYKTDIKIECTDYQTAKAIIGNYGITHWVFVDEQNIRH